MRCLKAVGRAVLFGAALLAGGFGRPPAAGQTDAGAVSAAPTARAGFSPSLQAGERAALALVPGASRLTAVVREAEETPLGSRRLSGRWVGRPGAAWTLVRRGAAWRGTVTLAPGERYFLTGEGEQIAVEKIVPAPGPSCACGGGSGEILPSQRPRGRLAAGSAPPRPREVPLPPGPLPVLTPGAAPVEFDVLVVYTPAALKAMGGTAAAVEAQAELAMAGANECYANSGLALRGRIVAVRAVNYVESGEIRTDLRHLDQPDDGVMDEAVDWRDEVGADFVCLFTSRASADGFKGYGLILQEFLPDYEQTAYSVVDVRSSVVEHLFAHEIGHNMGCDHDADNTTGLRLFPFSYGYRFLGQDQVLYRDVMAYEPGLSEAFFSNPNVRFQNTPTGAAGLADTATTLAASAPLFTHFRETGGRPGLASVEATAAETSVKAGAAPGQFTVHRTGSGRRAVTVRYEVGGSAVGGVHYETLPGSVEIPADYYSATVDVIPMPGAPPFGLGTVTLTLLPGDGYAPSTDLNVGVSSAAVTVFDKKPVVRLELPTDAPLNAVIGQPARLLVRRVGRLDADLTVNYAIGGTARPGVDYRALAGSVVIPAGADSAKLKVKVLPPVAGDTPPPDGVATVTLALTKTPAYRLDPSASPGATVTLVRPGGE